MQILITTPATVIKVRNKSFYIKQEEAVRTIHPKKITSISVGNKCLISTAAIHLAVAHQIPIFFTDNVGHIAAQLWSTKFGSHAEIRRQQIHSEEKIFATQKIIQWMQIKTGRQLQIIEMLLKKQKEKKEIWQVAKQQIATTLLNMHQYKTQKIKDCSASLMGTEGTISRIYFQTINTSLPAEYQFEGRSRQPALDMFNAVLNYLYGMLYGICENALITAGLDPYLGYLHADEYQTPAFTYDYIESFRPFADLFLINQCLEHKIIGRHFIQKENGFWLSAEGKKELIPAFNLFMQERIKINQKITTRTNALYKEAQLLAQELLAQSDKKIN